MRCPKCGTLLETYSKLEGGFCPECSEWIPEDIIEEWMDNE